MTKGPRVAKMLAICDGNEEMIEVKISSDMPLPTPRSVMSSPSHMMTAVPAVIVAIMTKIVKMESSGISWAVQPWNSCPGVRASATIPVDCRMARATVR